jgi:hypothetical protein
MELRHGNSRPRFCQPLSAADENDLILRKADFKIFGRIFSGLFMHPLIRHEPETVCLKPVIFSRYRSTKSMMTRFGPLPAGRSYGMETYARPCLLMIWSNVTGASPWASTPTSNWRGNGLSLPCEWPCRLGFLTHLISRSKRVVAEDQMQAVDCELAIMLNRCPAAG